MSDNDLHPLDALAEEFVARFRRGEDPSITEYITRYPQFADDIRDLFPAATLLESLKGPPRSAALELDIKIPVQLGDFRILREIGRGGMGIVYEAQQLSLDRRVALKVLPGSSRLSHPQIERFQREARAAGKLHHTNIVPVFGVGESDGLHYYVMQFIPGQGLDRVLAGLLEAEDTALLVFPAEQGQTRISPGRLAGQAPATQSADATPVPSEPVALETAIQMDTLGKWSRADLPLHGSGRADFTSGPEFSPLPSVSDPEYYRCIARIGIQVADALSHAHIHGVLHRDIKPANLLMDDDGIVWVTDFGLARMIEQENLTRPGEMAGTLRYSAPERFRGESDARSDLFSLGLTLYELCTLKPAYHETDPGRLLAQATEARLVRPRLHNPRVPRDLETVLLRALAPEPEARYPTAEEFSSDLRRFLDDQPVKARRASFFEHGQRWCRRNPAVAVLSAALFFTVAFGYTGVVWKWREATAHLGAVHAAHEQTRKALGREADERLRAQGNLDLALDAFERIAGQLALARPGTFTDAGSDEPSPPPVVSSEAAAILQDLVGFYERFAESNGNDPRLERDKARALRRVSTIRMRLRQYGEAEKALRKASELLSDESQLLDQAQVHSDLGVVLRAANRLHDASDEYDRSLEKLALLPPDEPLVQLEKARTYDLRANLEYRQGQLPQAELSLRTSLELLESLRHNDGKNPTYRHAQVRAWYDLAQVVNARDRHAASEFRTRAMAALETLTREYPAVPGYKAELCDMYLAGPPTMMRRSREQEQRWQRAAELASDLVKRYPAVPEYQQLQNRARQRVALILPPASKVREVFSSLHQAFKAHREPDRRSPRGKGMSPSILESRLDQADQLREKQDYAGSEKVLRQSLDQVQKYAGDGAGNPALRALLVRLHRSMGRTLECLGNKAEAERSYRQAEQLGKPK